MSNMLTTVTAFTMSESGRPSKALNSADGMPVTRYVEVCKRVMERNVLVTPKK